MPHVAFYITGHGFGHATRMAAVASALARETPGLEISLISTTPEWLFRLNLPCDFRLRPRGLPARFPSPGPGGDAPGVCPVPRSTAGRRPGGSRDPAPRRCGLGGGR